MFEERSNEIGVIMLCSQGEPCLAFQVVKVFRNEVGQIAVFGVRPNLLHRIEVWGVGRQRRELERFRKPLLEVSSRGSVNAPSIPDHDQFPPQLSTQIDDEILDSVRLDVLGMDLEVDVQAVLFGRNGDRRDDGEPVVTVPRIMNRGLTGGSPSAPDHRLQHEPALVHEDQDGFSCPSFFLSSARPCAATGRRRSRPVPALDVRVSGNSSPNFSESSKREPGDNSLQRSPQ